MKARQTYWSKANEIFSKYIDFLEVLKAIKDLECHSICHDGGGYKGDHCEIKNCALRKGIKGCWECSDYKVCMLLEPMKKVHPNLEDNLTLIKTEGADNWSSKRKGHYRWL